MTRLQFVATITPRQNTTCFICARQVEEEVVVFFMFAVTLPLVGDAIEFRSHTSGRRANLKSELLQSIIASVLEMSSLA
jgi:hypothetical protein